MASKLTPLSPYLVLCSVTGAPRFCGSKHPFVAKSLGAGVALARLGSSALGFPCTCGQGAAGTEIFRRLRGLACPGCLHCQCLAAQLGARSSRGWLAISPRGSFQCGMAVSEQWGAPITGAPPAESPAQSSHDPPQMSSTATWLHPVSEGRSWGCPGRRPHGVLRHQESMVPGGCCQRVAITPPNKPRALCFPAFVGHPVSFGLERLAPGPIPEAGPTPPGSQVGLSSMHGGPRSASCLQPGQIPELE